MGASFLIILAVAGTAFTWYRTIKGYRTGVLKIRSRTVDRRVSPREFAINLFVLALLAVVMLGATVLLIYGETHPGWRPRAENIGPMMRVPLPT
jgi:hypothetical protein